MLSYSCRTYMKHAPTIACYSSRIIFVVVFESLFDQHYPHICLFSKNNYKEREKLFFFVIFAPYYVN